MLVSLMLLSCAGGKKLSVVQEQGITVDVAVGSLDDVYRESADELPQVEVVEIEDLQGRKIIMNAVKDEETGEMVAQEQLNEIVVQAKFCHVAERNGVVDLVFELAVPVELQQRRWQVRFYPKYMYLGDTLRTDEIRITGETFRRVQHWEYMVYNNYLSRVVPEHEADSLYALSGLMATFTARHGYDSRAEEYYRRSFLEHINRKKDMAKGRIYDRFVVDPFPKGGVRLDSVVNNGSGVIRYYYVQTLAAVPGLRKVDMVLEGAVHTNGRKLCSLEATEPITFYISSISTLADETRRYLKKVVYRDMHFDASYNIVFDKGAWKIDPKKEDNAVVLENMKRHILEIIENEDYVLDSILVASACSPEGRYPVNDKLSMKRGEEIKEHLLRTLRSSRDSVVRDTWVIDAGEDSSDNEDVPGDDSIDGEIVKVTQISEDWESLYRMLEQDSLVQRDALVKKCRAVEDPDAREAVLLQGGDSEYIAKELYPLLRRVKLNFKLHRKGMIKDTVHTTVLDSVYMRGVEALKERDYRTAVTLLRPYGCYNSAVAYMCMGYDNSALEILEQLPRSAKRDYMLAIVYGRLGNEKLALEYFLASVEQDESMRHRGNLDPEIGTLIKKYSIFNQNYQ